MGSRVNMRMVGIKLSRFGFDGHVGGADFSLCVLCARSDLFISFRTGNRHDCVFLTSMKCVACGQCQHWESEGR